MLPAAFIALFLTVILHLALRPLAMSLHLVDKPGGRKRHVGVVPVIGGICMFGGFLVGSALIISDATAAFAIVGAFLLLLVGVVDDRYDLPASVRFGTQIAAVLLLVFGSGGGVQTLGDPLGVGELLMGPFSLLATVFFSLAVINAINMTDGLDGLAGSLSLVALCGVSATAIGTWVFGFSLIGTAVVLGFLGFNFPMVANRSVRTFMGDAGSTFLGFLLAWLCIALTQPPLAKISPVVALCLVAIPLYDLTSCFFRRILSGRSPFTADRNHFHHVLQEAGLRRRQVLFVLIVSAIIPAVAGLGLAWSRVPESVIFVLWILYGATIDFGFRYFRRVRRSRALTPL